MASLQSLLSVVGHQAAGSPAGQDGPPECDTNNGYDGRLAVRISAVFVVLVTSTFGRWH